jgi:hypothetical protein
MGTVREGMPESFHKGFHGAFMAPFGRVPTPWKAASKAVQTHITEMLSKRRRYLTTE